MLTRGRGADIRFTPMVSKFTQGGEKLDDVVGTSYRRDRDPASEYPWGAFAKLLGRQGALAEHAPHRSAPGKHTGIA
jgi:hypothetical protein